MTRTKQLTLGIFLILIGSFWLIVSSFNLKHDSAWLSVLLVSIISTISGVRIIDNL